MLELKNVRVQWSFSLIQTDKHYSLPLLTGLNGENNPLKFASWTEFYDSCLQCKNVITKIQRRIDKEGQQIIPLLTDLWKRTESHGNSLLDLYKIELRVDRLEYNSVPELISDVQVMLKSGMQYFGFSHEVSPSVSSDLIHMRSLENEKKKLKSTNYSKFPSFISKQFFCPFTPL